MPLWPRTFLIKRFKISFALIGFICFSLTPAISSRNSGSNRPVLVKSAFSSPTLFSSGSKSYRPVIYKYVVTSNFEYFTRFSFPSRESSTQKNDWIVKTRIGKQWIVIITNTAFSDLFCSVAVGRRIHRRGLPREEEEIRRQSQVEKNYFSKEDGLNIRKPPKVNFINIPQAGL